MSFHPVASVTRPDGRVKKFAHLETFDAYVKVWRQAGFVLSWLSPSSVVISRGLV